MRFYVYCDEDDHPVYEGRTMAELARKAGISDKCVREGFKKGWRPYVVIDDDDDEKVKDE